jgi:integrase
MAMAGLRRGEAAGLRWSDVDLAGRYLVVRQQVVQLDGRSFDCSLCGQSHRGLRFGTPKTASGEARRVDLGAAAVGSLLNHRLAQDEQKAQLGDAYADHDLVFSQDDGNQRAANAADALVPRRLRDHSVTSGGSGRRWDPGGRPDTPFELGRCWCAIRDSNPEPAD